MQMERCLILLGTKKMSNKAAVGFCGFSDGTVKCGYCSVRGDELFHALLGADQSRNAFPESNSAES